MKTNNPITKTLMAVLLVALVTAGGCKNFMSNSDDFKKKIQTEVDVANADKIPVRIIADSKLGSTSPAGQVTEKVDVAFSLLMTTSSDYGFIRWAAYSTTDLKTELGTEVVTFSNKTALETIATIHVARTDLQIQPICEKRPKVSSTSPALSEKGVYLNVPLKIYFSKKINPSSFSYDDGTKRSGAGLFKNITINGYAGTDASAPMEKYFKDPVLDTETGTILTFAPVSGSPVTPYTNLTVEVSQDVVDTAGLTMPDTYTFSYKYGSGNDTNPPTITTLDVGASAVNGYAGTLATDHRTNSLNSWIMVKATDLLKWGTSTLTTGSGLNHINIVESRVKDANGNNASETTTSSAPIGSDNDNAEYPFAYTMQIAKDGLIQIDATATDETNNTSPTPVSYQFVRDTTPPLLDASKVAIKSTGVNGFYNAASHTLEFTANPVDAGTSPYCSLDANNQTRFQIVDGSGTSVWSDWGTPAQWLAKSKTLEIPLAFADGTVTVNYQFKDDLENLSLTGLKDVVTKDTNPPTGTVSVIGTKEGGSVVTIGGKPFVNSKNLKVQVTTSDGQNGSNTAAFAITDTTAKPASIATTGTDTTTIDNVTLDAGTGALAVYAWFKDYADNSNDTYAATAKVYYDATKPTISKFWVSKANATQTDSEQYSAGTELYFGFIATDTPAGIAQFQYEVNGTASDKFTVPAKFITTGQMGTSSLKVDLVNCSYDYLGVTGQVLVTGKLTVPPTRGEDTIKLYLTDMVGNSTDSSTANNTANNVVFDDNPPTGSTVFKDAVSLANSAYASPYYRNASGDLFTNSVGPHALTTSVTDAPVESETVSGAYSYDLSGDFSTAPGGGYGFTPATPKVSTAKTRDGAFNLSSGDGLKALITIARDYAGLTSSSQTKIYLDKTPPFFAMSIRDPSGTSDLFTKAAGTASTILGTGVTTYKDKQAFDLYVSATDAGTGVKNTNYSWHLFTAPVASGSGTEVGSGGIITLSGGSGQAHITGIPATNGSGRYWIALKLKDNLENEGASGTLGSENYIGYVYDNTPPSISIVEPCPFVAGHPELAQTLLNKDGSYWTSTDQFVLRAKATDRPTTDPNGSGITKIKVSVSTSLASPSFDQRTYGAGTQTTDTDGRAIVYEPGNDSTWFYLQNYSGTINPRWGGVSTTDAFKFTCTFFDEMGNSTLVYNSVAPLYVKYDHSAPTFSANAMNNLVRGYTSNVWYTTGTGTTAPNLALTLSDGTGCGVKAWALTSSTSAAAQSVPDFSSVPAYGSAEWTSYTDPGATGWHKYSGAVTDTTVSTSSSILSESTPKYIYVHAIDYLGNAVSASGNGGALLQLDNTAPAVNSVTVTGTKSDGSTLSSVVTATSSVSVSLNVTEAESGISKLVFGSDFTPATTQSGLAAYTYSVSGQTITFTPATSGGGIPGSATPVVLTISGTLSSSDAVKTVSVTATDCVGNSTASSTKATTIQYDSTRPVYTAISVNGNNPLIPKISGAPGVGYAHMSLSFTEALSGVRQIIISGNAYYGSSADLSGIKLYSGGTTNGTGSTGSLIDPGDYDVAQDATSFTITFKDAKLRNTGTVNVCDIPLKTTLTGTSSDNLTADLVDNVGYHLASVANYTNLSRDSIAPAITGVTVVSTDSGSSSGWTISDTVNVTVTYTENESGLKTISFTGASTGDGATTVDASSALISGYSGTSAASSVAIGSGYPKGTGATVTITGIKLNASVQGAKKFSVAIQDAAGNDCSSTVDGTINLDTLPPPAPTVSHTDGANQWHSGLNWFTQGSDFLDFACSFTDTTPASASDTGSASGANAAPYWRGATSDVGSALSVASGATVLAATTTTSDYYYWSKDAAGNYSTSSTHVTVLRDIALPSTPIATPTDTSTTFYKTGVWWCQNDIAVVLSNSGDTGGSGFKEYGWKDVTTPGSLTWLGTGINSKTLTAAANAITYDFYERDNVLNEGATSSVTIQKDDTPPVVNAPSHSVIDGEYKTGDTYFTKLSSLSLGLSGTDSQSGIDASSWYYTVDSDSTHKTDLLSGTTFTWTSAAGSHVYHFHCMDNCGNLSADYPVTITIDSTTPTAPTVNASLINAWVHTGTTYYPLDNTGVAVTFSGCTVGASDSSGSGFDHYAWSTDGGTNLTSLGALTSYTIVPTYSLTSYTFWSVDRCGNQSQATGSYAVQIDGLAPAAPGIGHTTVATDALIGTDSWATSASTIAFTLSGGDDQAGSASTGSCSAFDHYAYSDDGGSTYTALVGTTATITATSTSTDYTFYAVDKAGNVSPSGGTRTVIKDTDAPSVPAPATAGGPVVTSSGSYTLSEVSDIVYLHDGLVAFTPSDNGACMSGTWIINTRSNAYSSVANFNAAYSSAAAGTKGSYLASGSVSGATLPATTTSDKYYIHVMDDVGLIGTPMQIYTDLNDTADSWKLDTTGPSVTSMTGTASTGSYWDSASNTLYYKHSTGSTTYTVDLLDASDQAGITGYNTTSTVATGTSVSLTPSSSTHIFVFDKVGNYTEVTPTYVDAAVPTITGTLWFDTVTSKIKGATVNFAGCGGAVTPYTSSSGTFNGTQVSGCDLPASNGDTTTVTIRAIDKLGQYCQIVITLKNGGSVYVDGTVVTSGSRRGIVPVGAGDVGKIYEFEPYSTPKKAYASSGSALVDWNSGAIPANWTGERTSESVRLTNGVTSGSALESVATVGLSRNDRLSFSTLSTRHAQALALARARFALSQNTDAGQNAADTVISPEIAKNVKQDDSGRVNGVGYNQELVRIAKSAMAPLAEQYLAKHGVSFDGTQLTADGQTASLQSESPQRGATAGPGIGMLIPAKNFAVFRRESGFGLVS